MSKVSGSNQQYRIDPLVSNLCIFVVLVCVGLLGFRYYEQKPCPDVDFAVLGDKHGVDKMIKFQNHTTGKHDFIWDFGDCTKASIKRSPIHVYKKPGEYVVRLNVDGRCFATETVEVKAPPKEKPSVVIPKIAGPSSVYAGKPLVLTCCAKGAVSYEWYMGDSKRPVSFKKTVSYVYDKPGYKTVTLIVNGETKRSAQKSIYVRRQDNEQAKEVVRETQQQSIAPAEIFIPKTPEVYGAFDKIKKKESRLTFLPDDSELQVEFMAILKGKGDRARFEGYLSKGADELLVVCNGNINSFNGVVEEMKGVDLVMKEFSTTRKDNKSIVKLTIKYKRKRNFLNL